MRAIKLQARILRAQRAEPIKATSYSRPPCCTSRGNAPAPRTGRSSQRRTSWRCPWAVWMRATARSAPRLPAVIPLAGGGQSVPGCGPEWPHAAAAPPCGVASPAACRPAGRRCARGRCPPGFGMSKGGLSLERTPAQCPRATAGGLGGTPRWMAAPAAGNRGQS